MSFLKACGIIVGRICFSLIFLMAGSQKFFAWSKTRADIGSMLSFWDQQNKSAFVDGAVNIIGNFVFVFMVLAALLEIFGALSILTGYKPRIGALCLLIFLIPTTFFMHPFWLYSNGGGELQFVMFFKNLSLIGALFFIWVYDGGYFGRRKRQSDHFSHDDEERKEPFDHRDHFSMEAVEEGSYMQDQERDFPG